MKIKILVILFSIIFMFIELFLNNSLIIFSINKGLSIWFNSLIPSIFPFLLISRFMINYGLTDIISEFTKPFISNKLHISSKCNYLIILSLISGLPTSSKIIKDAYLNHEITYQEFEYLISFCFFSNPLFIINIIGIGIFNSKLLGFLILLSHYISNFILAFIFRNKSYYKDKIDIRKLKKTIKNKYLGVKIGILIKDIIRDSINILWTLLGIIIIFIFLSNFIILKVPMNDYIKPLFIGTLELTSGIDSIRYLDINNLIKMIYSVILLSFGGISIHIQILAILDDTYINYKRFLLKRILSYIISVLIIIFIFISFKTFHINIF